MPPQKKPCGHPECRGPKVPGEFGLLPAKEGTCPECATVHEEWEPHNLCLYYQYHFYGQHRRFPTWKDAMAHCTDEVKAKTLEVLKGHGIEV